MPAAHAVVPGTVSGERPAGGAYRPGALAVQPHQARGTGTTAVNGGDAGVPVTGGQGDDGGEQAGPGRVHRLPHGRLPRGKRRIRVLLRRRHPGGAQRR